MAQNPIFRSPVALPPELKPSNPDDLLKLPIPGTIPMSIKDVMRQMGGLAEEHDVQAAPEGHDAD